MREIQTETISKQDTDHCICCNNEHTWNRAMLLTYGDKKRAVITVLCKKCVDEHQRSNFVAKKIEYLHGIAFEILRKT